jgi:NTE family protein
VYGLDLLRQLRGGIVTEMTEAATTEAISPRSWLVLAVCAGAAFVAFLDVTIVNIAFPAISRSFRRDSLADLSWVLNGYNVVFAALLVPAGRLADLVGRKRVFLIGLAIFAIASAGCGIAPSAGALIGWRVLQAIGAALVAPASLALLLPAFPAARRGMAVALWGATAAVAAATGPSLGGVLVDYAGWRWVFYVNLPLVLVVVLAGRRLLDETRDPNHGAIPDILGAALLAGGVGALALGIVKSADWTWSSPKTVTALLVGAALVLAFVARCALAKSPVLELALFRVRSFAVGNIGFVVFAAAFYGLLLANVLFLTGHWHYSALKAGVAITPGPAMAAVSSVIAGRFIDRIGPRAVLLPAALLFASGNVLFAVGLPGEPSYAVHFLPATLLTGLGVGASFAAMSAALVADLPPARFATGSAIGTCLRQVGAVLGIALLLGQLGANSDLHAFHVVYAGIAVGGLATAVVALFLGSVRASEPVAVSEDAIPQLELIS